MRPARCLPLALCLLLAGPAWGFDPDAPNQGTTPPPPPAPVAAPGSPVVAVAPNPTSTGPLVLPPNLKPTSLFIQPAEQAQINEAVAAYKRARENANKNAENQAKNFLNQLEELPQQAAAEPPKPVPFTYPQFFLELLNYRGPNDWLVQINGRKFAPHIFPGEHWLKIIMVDRDSVVVEWTPKDMDKVTDAWMVVPMNDVSRSDVLVDSVRDTVTFTLRPNQTFSSYAMRVLEGKVKPVTVMVLNGETVSAAPAPGPGNTASGTATVAVPPTASPTAQAAPPATEEKKEGVKALDDTYKKLGID